VSDGYGVSDVPGRILGDVGVDGRVRLLDRTDGGLGLAGQARVELPTGAGRAWLGEPGAGAHLQANAAWGRRSVLAANLGARLGARDRLDTLQVGHVMTFGAGAWIPVGDRADGSLEFSGERYHGSADAAGNTRLEWLADVRLSATDQLTLNLGGGTGLSQGAGAPDYRLLAGATWSPRQVTDAAPPPPSGPDAHVAKPPGPGTQLATLRFVTADGAALARVQLTIDEGPEVGRYETPDGGTLGLWLTPGTYQGTVEVPGFQPQEVGFRVPEDRGVDKRIQLTATARRCAVSFEITDLDRTPIAAHVRSTDGRIDVHTDASTGLASVTLPEGIAVEVIIGALGRATDHRAVSCTEGADGRLSDVAMAVTLPPPRARLEGARIRLDDKIHFELDSTVIRQ
ncbi:MAG: hypothetical protein VX000_17265, partial [Myxococcota bacterium]|nr:hypothetical protein [Myxococcota bacterium]